MSETSDSTGSPIGLAFCGPNWGTSFCICKTIELAASLILLIIIVYDMIIRIKKQREFSWFAATCILMGLALIMNIAYDIDHSIPVFFYLEIFFVNFYFILIMFQVGYKFLIKYYPQRKAFWVIFYMIFSFAFAVVLVGTILRFFLPKKECDELWLIIINIIVLLVFIIFVIVGIRFDNQQKKRILGIYNTENYYNPLPYMWVWIIVNIFSQLCSLVQNVIFKFNTVSGCHFTSNEVVDPYIKLIFAILGFHLGMAATVIFYRMKYKRQQQNKSRKKSLDETVGQNSDFSTNKKIILELTDVKKIQKVQEDILSQLQRSFRD